MNLPSPARPGACVVIHRAIFSAADDGRTSPETIV